MRFIQLAVWLCLFTAVGCARTKALGDLTGDNEWHDISAGTKLETIVCPVETGAPEPGMQNLHISMELVGRYRTRKAVAALNVISGFDYYNTYGMRSCLHGSPLIRNRVIRLLEEQSSLTMPALKSLRQKIEAEATAALNEEIARTLDPSQYDLQLVVTSLALDQPTAEESRQRQPIW